jgi:large subunit ribosomal protein L3
LGLKESPLKVTLGFEEVKESRLNKARLGFFKKNNLKPVKMVCEFETESIKDYQLGQEIKADLFRPGDFVDVTGTSIGKGFQGGMKRWGWVGGPGGHGSMHHRRIGSVASSTEPSRVFKGKTMPGHMGDERVTTQSLRVMDVNIDKNLILIKGSIPGCKRNYILINKSKKKAFKSFDEIKPTVVRKINPMKQSKAKVKGK